MLALRSIFFALLFPGTVTVFVPYFIVSGSGTVSPGHWALWRYLFLLPSAIGAGILFRCIWDFAVAGRGTLAPVDPPKRLVVRGLYRYVRNPMYLGVMMILFGECLTFESIRLFYYTICVFVIVHLFIVFYEEPALHRQFGESYEIYCNNVRRWMPHRPLNG
jgi:protein-S-isoprenylcysteine O-methyltransferase Ste14